MSFPLKTVAVSRIIKHYRGLLITQGLKVFGYVEFLGNPAAILGSLGQGFMDLYEEPRNALRTDPSQFHKGLGRGLGSLGRNTVKAVSTFGSTMTGAVNTGTPQHGQRVCSEEGAGEV